MTMDAPHDVLHDIPPENAYKTVPPERFIRERLRFASIAEAAHTDRSRPLSYRELERLAWKVLRENAPIPAANFTSMVNRRHGAHPRYSQDLPLTTTWDAYHGWTMVMLASAFWRTTIATVPYARRVLLLPHCLRDPAKCPAKFSPRELLCQECGACDLARLRQSAKERGYQVLIAEGSPAVIDLILHGEADALLGVACLDSLEKAFDRVLVAGIPCAAVPLHEATCAHTQTDLDWVQEMLEIPYLPTAPKVTHFLPAIQQSSKLFHTELLDQMLPRHRSAAHPSATTTSATQTNQASNTTATDVEATDPFDRTEQIAIDFLKEGGKHFRPFITLAAYLAARREVTAASRDVREIVRKNRSGGESSEESEIPTMVSATALAVEVFHKASLIHDDIEDADLFRYGRPALHQRYGVPAAINLGDYLIGLGYRLITRQIETVARTPGEQARYLAITAVPGILAEAHIRLAEGQGAEIFYREELPSDLSVTQTLRMYALKTSPAFEAALLAGFRLGFSTSATADVQRFEALRPSLAQFAQAIGVAFQIRNDLDDWKPQQMNKRRAGSDIRGQRPTLLLAMAHERLGENDRQSLDQWLHQTSQNDSSHLVQILQIYEKANVFELAESLVARYRLRAQQIAAHATFTEPLRSLLLYLTDLLL